MPVTSSLQRAAFAALFLGSWAVGSANATNLYWDGTALGTGVGTGWDAVTSWSTDANNPDVNPAAIPGASDVAVFNISTVNTAQTVNMYANQSAQGLSFTSNGDVTIQGGDANHTLTLGTGGITVSGANNGLMAVGSPTNAAGQRVAITLSGSQSWVNNGALGILEIGQTSSGTIAPSGGPMTLILDGTNTTLSSTSAHISATGDKRTNAVYGLLTNGSGGEVLSVVKNGPGMWVLANNGNTFSGGVTLNDGILAISVDGTNNLRSIGTGTLTLNGGELRGTGSFGTGGASVGVSNNVVVTGNASIVSKRVDPIFASNMVYTGAFTSPGTNGNGPVLTLKQSLSNGVSSNSFRPSATFSGFNGTLRFLQELTTDTNSGSIIQFTGTSAGGNTDLSHAKVVFESTSGSPVGTPFAQTPRLGIAANDKMQFGELSGNGTMGFFGEIYTFEVGALNTDSVFSGDITQNFRPSTTPAGVSGYSNLKKVGTGSLTLSGDNSYIGNTTISNGTLVAGIDALVSKANISKTATGVLSVNGNVFDNSFSGVGPHGLSDGDRVFIENISIDTSNTNNDNTAHLRQPYYVVNSTTSSFQLSLTPGGAPDTTFVNDPLGGIGIAMPTAFGAGTTPIALGDGTGGAVKLLAGTASRPSVTIARDVTVAAGGGAPTFGSTVDGNSAFTGAISLAQNTSLTSAATGANALTISGAISSTGAFGLTKVGSGKAILSGANTYTGDTSVQGGTLSLTTPYLANAADVYLATGTLLNLNFVGTDTIDSLFINFAGQATGTWGGTGSGAAHISPLITGTGMLLVSTVGVGSLAGDYNSDGKVDAADYVLWRKNPAAFGGSPGGYNTWRANFGNPPGSGSGLAGAGSVPEPTSFSLLVSAIIGSCVARRRR